MEQRLKGDRASLSLSLSLSHTHTHTQKTQLLSLDMYVQCTYRDTPHTDKTYSSSLSRVQTYTQPLSPHTCKTGFLSLDHTHTLSLSLTHTHYVHPMYISRYHVWISIILRAFSRMSMARTGRMARNMIGTVN